MNDNVGEQDASQGSGGAVARLNAGPPAGRIASLVAAAEFDHALIVARAGARELVHPAEASMRDLHRNVRTRAIGG